tara:strand:- start:186 stop:587 length:402 start_codon:yes stop_codon:yes gene_type:complete
MMKKKILCLVDDDDVYQYTFLRQLKGTDFAKDILLFSDGELAMEFIETHINNVELLPDIIFLDINMPIMDGWEFLEEFVQLKPKVGKEILIYMVSSSIDPADIQRAKTIGDVSDYLIKPIVKEHVKAIIEENV